MKTLGEMQLDFEIFQERFEYILDHDATMIKMKEDIKRLENEIVILRQFINGA